LLFASDSLLKLSFVYKLWPVIILILGIGLVGIFAKRKASGDIFLAAGEYLICFSGLAFYCNFTSWKNMSEIWPLFIAFLGIVFVTLFVLHSKKRFLLLLGLLHLSLSIFFFLVFSLTGQLWWTIFILVGVSILVSGWII
jgi:hypothetical protein